LEAEETLENITSQSVTELHGNSEHLYEAAFGLQTTLRSHLEKARNTLAAGKEVSLFNHKNYSAGCKNSHDVV
jgi:hypothetical protein